MNIYPITLNNLYRTQAIQPSEQVLSTNVFNEFKKYESSSSIISQSIQNEDTFYTDSTLLIDQARTLIAIRQRIGDNLKGSIDSQLSGIYSQINTLRENNAFNFQHLFDGGHVFRVSEPIDSAGISTAQVIQNIGVAQSFI